MNKSEITNWSILATVAALLGLSVAVAVAFLVFTIPPTTPVVQQEVGDSFLHDEDAVIPAEVAIQYNEDGSIDTSNWKTYRNEEYGFEVKYPSDWIAETKPNPGALFSVGNASSDKELYDIRCNKLLSGIPAQTRREKLDWSEGREVFPVISKEYIETDDYIAYREYSKLDESSSMRVLSYGESILYRFLDNKDSVCEVSYVTYDRQLKSLENEKIFDAFASSIKFLVDDDGSIDTSNWKIYRNEEYGFEVKYPQEWTVKEFRSFSPGLSLGPVNCELEPSKCPILSFAFTDIGTADQQNQVPPVVINILDSETDYETAIEEKFTWHEGGIITGCEVELPTKTIEKYRMLGSTFYSDSEDSKYTEEVKLMCSEKRLGRYMEAIYESLSPSE